MHRFTASIFSLKNVIKDFLFLPKLTL